MPGPDTTDEQAEFPASPRPREPDAHGQAALLLAESILLALVDAGALSINKAADVVRSAAEIKAEVAEEIGESSARMRESIGLLAVIERSIESIGRNHTATGHPQEV